MTKIRVGTFNCENLFVRYRFDDHTKSDAEQELKQRGVAVSSGEDKELQELRQGFSLDENFFQRILPASRDLTAKAIQAIAPDVLALQEIENLDTLRFFNTHFLPNRYKYQLSIDSHDPRGIDVALLSRYPFGAIRTHQFDAGPGGKLIFSRDCLEVEVGLPENVTLTFFVNHFKSMMEGRAQTAAKRLAQTTRVAEIIRERFGPDPSGGAFVVLGDFNDYYDAPGKPAAALAPLVGQPWAEDVVQRLPEEERWTHFFTDKKDYKQLDYLLLSKSLAAQNPKAVPVIERRGLPLAATRVPKHFPGVGQTDPEASDHCPVAIDLTVSKPA